MAPQLHRNCTSERPTCSFLELLPQTYTYCQLAGGAPSSRCLRLCFSTLYRKCFPHLRAHQKPDFSTLLSFTKSVVKKAEEDVSPPRTSRLAVGIISLSFRIYCSIGGVQQQATRASPQKVDLHFLLPHHMTTRHLSEFLLQAKHRKKAKDLYLQVPLSQ